MAWLYSALIAAPLLLTSAFVVQTITGLLRNYAAARTIGVPIRFIPISPLNPFWVLVDRKALSFLRRLPFLRNSSFARYNWRGWEVADRYRSHQEIGDLWVLVTPFKNWIYVNDPEALNSIFRRGSDFPRPVFVNGMFHVRTKAALKPPSILEVFGPNIATATGEAWKTQRKIALHCFNEQNNEIVWKEALTLARDVLSYWTSKPSINTAADDLRTLSLHVLSRAGFGKSFKFESQEDHQRASGDKATASSMNHKKALETILENCVLILALGTKFIANPWLPKKLRDVYAAYLAFRTYMTEIYEEEKAAYAAGRVTDSNLMRSMIRASQAEAVGMTEAEIYGNMFVFNFAGHDTVAHSFTFSIFFLAANPAVQDWLAEEVTRVFGDRPIEAWDYRADFPRLKRCLAVLYETLRLYTPVPAIKWTADKAVPLVVGGKTYVLPPDCMVAPSYGSVQTDPRFWGSDSLEWKPSRFIVKRNGGGDDGEDFRVPVRGAFIGWSDGARDCPGRKFSQVEFVAALAVLFRSGWRVEPVTKPGETIEAARRRVLDLIENDSGSVLLLQMLHPERAPLVWKRQ
ncbi:cytochrome P450 [Canariomyces notabilis]|uniref:Cytochrome P450 n=1 Tax=Canariomyces notabilis TaxID=2074819 RepID=A0AAN6YY38_9PEZI|nr:cytochrome P450 [Canariomyces arenarius]